ncbi:MAG: hypothetical protein K2Y37_14375 [Pirellulales bacterium]|nr:hypothetical protein [Pirellulales bacterium]
MTIPDYDAHEAIAIPLSKGKILLLLFGSIAFVAISIWMWSYASEQQRYNPLSVQAVAVAGVLFFGACAIYSAMKFIDTKPGLVIDQQGIVDNSNAAAVGRVSWRDIVGLSVTTIAGQRMLTIELANPQQYIERLGFIRRLLNSASYRMTGSPINISANGLAIKFDDLVGLVGAEFAKYGQPGDSGPSQDA